MISYAGVNLDFPPPDVLSRVRRHLDYRRLALWDDLPGAPAHPVQALPVRAWDPWPVRNPQALPARPWLREGPLRLNTLLWPSGASRWSVFHAIVDDAAMDKIRGATGSFGQPLVIEDGGDVALSLTMYPLPPRPLSQIAGANGFSLLTLLDRRAYWPWLSAEIDVVGGTTTWADLFDAIASALGVTLDVDDVPAAYLSPPAGLSSAYDSLPTLLDAACLSCGLRFAAALDGTSYRCWSVAAAQAQVARNLAGVTNPRVAGGLFLQGTDLNGILPAAVQVVFPRADDGTPNPAPVAVPVTLASLNLPSNPPGGAPVGGIGGLTKTFHSSAVATFASGSPTNSAALAALATRAATDWYTWQATGVYDVAYAGVAPWLTTGADGLVEYAHAPDIGSGGGILSRFRRDTYLDQAEALWHHTVTPCAAIPTRVRVTGTTLTDTCYYPAELVVRSGCADIAVSPAVAVWLRLDGGTVPGAGDVHLGSPEGVRPADGLPVYVAAATAAPAAGAVGVRHRDGTVVRDPVRWFEDASPAVIPPGDGFLTWDVSAGTGVVRLTFADASLTQRGLVNTASQSFAGLKTFQDGWVVYNPSTGLNAGLHPADTALGITTLQGTAQLGFVGPALGMGGGTGVGFVAWVLGATSPSMLAALDTGGNAFVVDSVLSGQVGIKVRESASGNLLTGLTAGPSAEIYKFVGGLCVGHGSNVPLLPGDTIDGGTF
jgi:hypothetical protein